MENMIKNIGKSSNLLLESVKTTGESAEMKKVKINNIFAIPEVPNTKSKMGGAQMQTQCMLLCCVAGKGRRKRREKRVRRESGKEACRKDTESSTEGKKIMHKEGLRKRPHKEPETSSSESDGVKYDDSMDEVSSGNERILQWNE